MSKKRPSLENGFESHKKQKDSDLPTEEEFVQSLLSSQDLGVSEPKNLRSVENPTEELDSSKFIAASSKDQDDVQFFLSLSFNILECHCSLAK